MSGAVGRKHRCVWAAAPTGESSSGKGHGRTTAATKWAPSVGDAPQIGFVDANALRSLMRQPTLRPQSCILDDNFRVPSRVLRKSWRNWRAQRLVGRENAGSCLKASAKSEKKASCGACVFSGSGVDHKVTSQSWTSQSPNSTFWLTSALRRARMRHSFSTGGTNLVSERVPREADHHGGPGAAGNRRRRTWRSAAWQRTMPRHKLSLGDTLAKATEEL